MDAERLGKVVVTRLQKSGLDPRVLADLAGVSYDTVASWKVSDGRDKRLPRGTTLNRVWHLLALIGLPSPEMDRVDDFGRYLGQLLAFGVVSLDMGEHICGANNQQSVLRAVRGETEPVKPRYTVGELRALYDSQLKNAIKEVHEHLAIQPQPDATPTPAPTSPAVPPMAMHIRPQATREEETASAAPPLVAPATLMALSATLSEMLPTLRVLASSNATDADRALFLAMMGGTLFEIGNLLQRLSSSRAYRTSGE